MSDDKTERAGPPARSGFAENMSLRGDLHATLAKAVAYKARAEKAEHELESLRARLANAEAGSDGLAVAYDVMEAELKELRLTLAAEQGKPEGAPSEGWVPNEDRQWWKGWGQPGAMLVTLDADCNGWLFSSCDMVGGAPTAREAMKAADKAMGEGGEG